MRKKYIYIIYNSANTVHFIGFDTLSAISRKEKPDNTIKIFDEVSDAEGPSAVSMMIDIFNGGEIPEGNKSRAIVCVETGVVYRTVYEASKTLKIATSSLYPHLKGLEGHKSVGGLTFRYASHGGADD